MKETSQQAATNALEYNSIKDVSELVWSTDELVSLVYTIDKNSKFRIVQLAFSGAEALRKKT
jgi:hypothetical protein